MGDIFSQVQRLDMLNVATYYVSNCVISRNMHNEIT